MMSDLDTYLTHCYDLLLKGASAPVAQEEDAELCACATLVTHDDNH
jgi:hypothetical protein